MIDPKLPKDPMNFINPEVLLVPVDCNSDGYLTCHKEFVCLRMNNSLLFEK
jgi:hypothetical protein